jgi:hypothetical protein
MAVLLFPPLLVLLLFLGIVLGSTIGSLIKRGDMAIKDEAGTPTSSVLPSTIPPSSSPPPTHTTATVTPTTVPASTASPSTFQTTTSLPASTPSSTPDPPDPPAAPQGVLSTKWRTVPLDWCGRASYRRLGRSGISSMRACSGSIRGGELVFDVYLVTFDTDPSLWTRCVIELIVLMDGKPIRIVTPVECLSGIQHNGKAHLGFTMSKYVADRRYWISAKWTGIYDSKEVGSGGNTKSRVHIPS